MTKQEERRAEAERITELVLEGQPVSARGFEISAGVTGSEVSVRDVRTGLLVAYSSTRADFEDSLTEFVLDYMV